MALPPRHKIDHEPVFVWREDTAWDHDRIEYELGVAAGRREPEPGRPVPAKRTADHPWLQYVTGNTRGDLASVREYLAHEAGELGPTRFHFRRLPLTHWAAVKDLRSTGLEYQAAIYAVRNSLAKVSDLELEGGKAGEPLTENDLVTLRERFGNEVFEQLGRWAIKASEELSEAEKKPLGS